MIKKRSFDSRSLFSITAHRGPHVVVTSRYMTGVEALHNWRDRHTTRRVWSLNKDGLLSPVNRLEDFGYARDK